MLGLGQPGVLTGWDVGRGRWARGRRRQHRQRRRGSRQSEQWTSDCIGGWDEGVAATRWWGIRDRTSSPVCGWVLWTSVVPPVVVLTGCAARVVLGVGLGARSAGGLVLPPGPAVPLLDLHLHFLTPVTRCQAPEGGPPWASCGA